MSAEKNFGQGFIIRKSKAVPRAHQFDASGLHTRAEHLALRAQTRIKENKIARAAVLALASVGVATAGKALNTYDRVVTGTPVVATNALNAMRSRIPALPRLRREKTA